MRVFTALLSHETNSFSPVPTGYGEFEKIYARAGGSHEVRTDIWTTPLKTWRRRAEELGWEVVEGHMGKAMTAGLVVRSAYERLRDAILDDLRRAMPVDCVILNLHGAMIADGYDDCEGDILTRVREIVGSTIPVFSELDCHGHITDAMVANADALVSYKEYPHTDFGDRAADIFELARRTLQGEIKPTMVAFDCRMLGFFPTSRQPVRGFVDRIKELENKNGILSISLNHGYFWGDVADEGVKIIVVADGDLALATRTAENLGREFFALRDTARLPFTPFDEAINILKRGAARPIVISDTADGQGGGGPGDSTFVLREILTQGITNTATAIFWDPQALATCQQAGAGASFRLRLGGKTGEVSGAPLDVDVKVLRIVENAVQTCPAGNYPFGPAAVLEIAGNLIVISPHRVKMEDISAFTSVGIDPRNYRGLLLKGQHNFYDSYAPIADQILYIDTPGACRPDISKISFKKIRRPIWPLDPDFMLPDR